MSTLGIVGAGNMGRAVASLATRAGIDVVLSNTRDPKTLASLANALGPFARTGTIDDAARSGDWVLLPIPFSAYRNIDPEPFTGQIIIETSNYYPGYSDPEPELDAGTATSSSLMQRHFSASRVVKAFNTIYTEHLKKLSRPPGARDRSALPIAGNDRAAVDSVAGFLDLIGFDVVKVGDLAESWRFEPASPAFVKPYQVRPDVHFTQDPGAVATAATIQRAIADAHR
jgi:8-hydroxy-5-deazaflavin:NADPH oxidoreductase